MADSCYQMKMHY